MNRIINQETQRGMVLVIALIMLLVLTIVAVVAMRSTTVDIQMTTNTMLKSRAFQGSESARRVTGVALIGHVVNEGWPTSVGGPVDPTSAYTIPGEIKIRSNADEYIPVVESGSVSYMYDADGDGNPSTGDANCASEAKDLRQGDICADIEIELQARTVPAGGSPTIGQGALGTGGGAPAGGAHLYFDVRSTGYGPGNARSETAADYRIVVN